MKTRMLVAVAVASGALVLAVGAAAKTTLHRGPTNANAAAAGHRFHGRLGSGTLALTIASKHLSSFKFLSVPIACKGGPETASGRDAADSFALNGGDFNAILRSTNDQFSGRIALKGHVSGGSAAGTFRLRGRRVPIDGGTGHRCDTGTISWKAG